MPKDTTTLAKLLELRSSHGPFTSRLGDASVDLAIDAAGTDGIALSYNFPTKDVPEFVQTFAAWLEQEHSITPGDELRVAMYAHASNGGIKIDAHGATNIKGLFACGEATGGMHGADRLGGLSSANGLVFGRIAGASAAAFAERSAHALPASGFQQHNSQPDAMQALNTEMVLSKLYSNQTQRIKPLSAQQARTATSQLKHLMSTYAMINAQARD